MKARALRPASRLLAVAVALAVTVVGIDSADAVQPTVNLGTAASYGVLAGSTITNTGTTTVTGDLGLSPGTSVTNTGTLAVSGTQNVANAPAGVAQNDLNTAYTNASGRTPVTGVPNDLVGQVLVPGVYHPQGAALSLTGTVTLDGGGDNTSVFIFEADSTLITASGSNVALINGAQACHVFWRVGSSATLGTGSSFAGTILAQASITAQTGTAVTGQLLASTGAVTLDTDTINAQSACLPNPPPPVVTPSPSATPTATPTPSRTPTATRTPTPSRSPSSTPLPTRITGSPTATSTGTGRGTASARPTGTRKPTRKPSPGASSTAHHSSPATSSPAGGGSGSGSGNGNGNGNGSGSGSGSGSGNGINGFPSSDLGTSSLPRTGADHVGSLVTIGVLGVVLGGGLLLAARFPAMGTHLRLTPASRRPRRRRGHSPD